MKRPGLLALLACFSLSVLPAQDKTAAPAALDQAESAAPDAEPFPPFPIIPLLETAFAAELAWRPDWPQDIPPDAFAVKGKALRVSLAIDGGEYRLRRDVDGRLAEFPALAEGVLVQAEALRGPDGGILGFSLTPQPSPAQAGSLDREESGPWAVDFPEPLRPDSPLPVSGLKPVWVSRGESVYFVLFLEGAGEISETWYDSGGDFAGYYKARITRNLPPQNGGGGIDGGAPWRILSLETRSDRGTETEYYRFESGGNLSEVSSSAGIFSAVYGARGLPLYRELPPIEAQPRSYALQWDERGLLVRQRGASEGLDNPDYRYEYTLDEHLNWVERWETGMIRRFGVLIPTPIQHLKRQIVYGTEE
jgi:hypothetical protein